MIFRFLFIRIVKIKHTDIHIHIQKQQHTVQLKVGLSVPAVTTDSRCPHTLARYCGECDNQAVEERVQMHLITGSRQQGRPGQRDSGWNVLYCKARQEAQLYLQFK